METALSALIWIVTFIAGVWAFCFVAVLLLFVGIFLWMIFGNG